MRDSESVEALRRLMRPPSKCVRFGAQESLVPLSYILFYKDGFSKTGFRALINTSLTDVLRYVRKFSNELRSEGFRNP